jgi:hypothetical protein
MTMGWTSKRNGKVVREKGGKERGRYEKGNRKEERNAFA